MKIRISYIVVTFKRSSHGKSNFSSDFSVIRISFCYLRLSSSKMCSYKAERSSIQHESDRCRSFVSSRTTKARLHAVRGNIANTFGQMRTNVDVETNSNELLVS